MSNIAFLRVEEWVDSPTKHSGRTRPEVIYAVIDGLNRALKPAFIAGGSNHRVLHPLIDTTEHALSEPRHEPAPEVTQ